MSTRHERHNRRAPQKGLVKGSNGAHTGIVTAVVRGGCKVRVDGQMVNCIARNGGRPEDRVDLAVGDEVEFGWADGGLCILRRVLPRRSALSKTDPKHPGVDNVIAANVDLAVLVVTVAQPPLRIRLVDRFLVAATRGQVTPILCVNKVDLIGDEDDTPELMELKTYEELGVQVIACSTVTGRGLDKLKTTLKGKRSVLVGHSGVGKSSLINALNPDLHLPTAPLKKDASRGKYTTTHAVLLELFPGTEVIDTPGLKDFGVREMTAEDLKPHFPDFQAYATQCEYANCTHTSEPDCGVKLAVRDGHIKRSRYESYLKLMGMSVGNNDKGLGRPGRNHGNHVRNGEVVEGAFKCANCGAYVSPNDAGTQHRNHCPNCLFSVHLDDKPGDRAAYCGGLMEPIAVWVRHGGEWALIHRCQECGALSSNRIAADDNEVMLLSLAVRPLSSPPFPLSKLADLLRRTE